MKQMKCEQCGVEFERICKRRFCSKKCWHKFNAKTIASFNDLRFQWKNATDEEKLDRIKKRFEENVIRKEGCWGWKGYFDKDGYPLMGSGAHQKGFHERRGHRISYLLYNKEEIENRLVCHRCDNPGCVNPDHLFIGSNQDNSDDKIKKGRGNKGSRHGNAKLTEELVIEIRKKFDQGVMIKKIMEDYKISRQTAHDLKYRKKGWLHI